MTDESEWNIFNRKDLEKYFTYWDEHFEKRKTKKFILDFIPTPDVRKMIDQAKLALLESAIEKDKEGRLTLNPRVLFKVYEELQAEK